MIVAIFLAAPSTILFLCKMLLSYGHSNIMGCGSVQFSPTIGLQCAWRATKMKDYAEGVGTR